jgi:hypothetical protein
MSATIGGRTLHGLGIVSTLVDAGLAFARRDTRAGALLLGAAVLSTRFTGVGVLASVLVRLLRRAR